VSDTHPRYIVAGQLRSDLEIEYSVVDTTLRTDDVAEVLFTVPGRGIATQVCEALNFHHDLAAAPKADGQ
jgi:hypothetical protein